MLYVNTNNKNLTYTAYQALEAEFEPAAGVIAPLKLPIFSKSDLDKICNSSISSVISLILNKFFYSRINVSDIELIIGNQFFSTKELDRRTILVGTNSDIYKCEAAILKLLYSKEYTPSIWSKCAVRLSLIASFLAELRRVSCRKIDFAVNSDDIYSIIPVFYAKIMGFPIDNIIIGASGEDGIWKYLHNSSAPFTDVYSYFLHGLSLVEDPIQYNGNLFTYIVSSSRAKEIVTNMKHSNGTSITRSAAFSYGVIQDYRAITGENKTTIVFNA